MLHIREEKSVVFYQHRHFHSSCLSLEAKHTATTNVAHPRTAPPEIISVGECSAIQCPSSFEKDCSSNTCVCVCVCIYIIRHMRMISRSTWRQRPQGRIILSQPYTSRMRQNHWHNHESTAVKWCARLPSFACPPIGAATAIGHRSILPYPYDGMCSVRPSLRTTNAAQVAVLLTLTYTHTCDRNVHPCRWHRRSSKLAVENTHARPHRAHAMRRYCRRGRLETLWAIFLVRLSLCARNEID